MEKPEIRDNGEVREKGPDLRDSTGRPDLKSMTQEELSELARILAQRREVPPSWEDVEGYCSILENEGGFADPAAIRNASEEDLRRYLEELKRRK